MYTETYLFLFNSTKTSNCAASGTMSSPTLIQSLQGNQGRSFKSTSFVTHLQRNTYAQSEDKYVYFSLY